jgi:ADP-ribose pyrophosphatase YjhB (NUDIX family)
MGSLPDRDATPAHVVLGVVLQVRDGRLSVLLWERALAPFAGAWALPGGRIERGERLEESLLRHLEAKVDLRKVAHLEQLATYGDPDRAAGAWELATAYLGLVPVGVEPEVPADTTWHPVEELPPTAFDHGAIAIAGRERLRGKLSYTNIGYALAPAAFTLGELRELYVAALGHDVSATNLRRVLERRGAIVSTGARRGSGRAGGRPAEEFRFTESQLEITDRFATLRPPG